MTQAQINSSVDWSIMNLTGHIPDSAGHFVGECLSLVKREFENRTGESAPASPNGWGDGYDQLPGVLAKYFTVESFNRNRAYPKGSYVINTPTHHIAVYLNQVGNNLSVWEQNADPDGSPSGIKVRDGSRIDVILIPKIDVDSPTPVPTPAMYSVVETYPNGKQIQLNKQPTNLWGMNYHFDHMKDNPVEVHDKGEVWTITNKVHHEDGYDYYRRDSQVDGFNVLDCDDYVPPTPQLPPSAPVPIPSPTAPYQVIKTILAFGSSNDAANHINAKGTVSPGSYLVFNRRTVASTGLEVLNVTKIGGQAGSWINPEDNLPDPDPVVIPSTPIPPVEIIPTPVVPTTPVPAPIPRDDSWKATYVSFDPIHRTPRVYKALSNLVIRDISGARGTTIYVKAGDKLHVFGTFTKDNTQYGRLKIRVDTEFRYYYAARITDMKRLATADLTPLVKVMDYFNLNRSKIERYEEDVINFMEMKPWFKKKNKNKEGIKK